MKLGIIVQARMGSTRLPGKILKPFYKERTLLSVLLDRLHQIPDAKVIVATTDNPNNDELEQFLKNQGEFVYRGSENDVLNRFIGAAETFQIDGIIRICSDNPFMDIHGLKKLAELAKTSTADYIGFRINDKPSILTHFGFWGEYVTLEALKKVEKTTEVGTPAHEHVTFHLYNNMDIYRCEWIECPDFLQGRDDIRLTIDTPEDFEIAQKTFVDLKKVNDDFTIKEVVDYLDSHKSLIDSMKISIEQNSKKYV